MLIKLWGIAQCAVSTINYDDDSEQILLHPATANDTAFCSIQTIGPMKIVQYAATFMCINGSMIHL